MSNLEKLYYNMEKLSDSWGDMPETKEAGDRLEAVLGEELYNEYEDIICECMSANEKQGFIKGFQYAVSLLTGGKAVSA